MLIGVVHGLAGSAPLLALIPLGVAGSAWTAMAYLVVFSLGVLVAMPAVGGVLGSVLSRVAHVSAGAHAAMMGVLAAASIVVGVVFVAASV